MDVNMNILHISWFCVLISCELLNRKNENLIFEGKRQFFVYCLCYTMKNNQFIDLFVFTFELFTNMVLGIQMLLHGQSIFCKLM